MTKARSIKCDNVVCWCFQILSNYTGSHPATTLLFVRNGFRSFAHERVIPNTYAGTSLDAKHTVVYRAVTLVHSIYARRVSQLSFPPAVPPVLTRRRFL